MRRGALGRYMISNEGGETVRAFIPDVFPPFPPIDISGARHRLLEDAALELGRLDSITFLLPNPELFLYSYIRKEAVLSSQIEGTQSSLSDLLLFEIEEAGGVPLDDVVEVSNYVAALEHGLKRLQEGFPLSLRLIREMHAVLLSRGRGSDKSPGEFRRTQNWIGGTRPGNAHFVPPPPEQVTGCMAVLERFIHDENPACPALVKAALAHAQFETIHPFLDGNGRIGRLLIAFILHHAGVLSQPLLYLSLYFMEHRQEYYRLLDLVRSDGDWESWLDFFLEGVAHTAAGAVQTARSLDTLFRTDAERVQSEGRMASTALRVFDCLRRRPLVTLKEICRQTGLSYPAAGKGMQVLARLDIAKEVTKRKRNRVYAYQRYLAQLNAGTERTTP